MEITQMLVLSTAHITYETCDQYLPNDIDAFEKGDYGWFVYCGEIERKTEHPDDLQACVQFAVDSGCGWIMFDRDGPVVDDLPEHIW